jgi:hypothetical protein
MRARAMAALIWGFERETESRIAGETVGDSPMLFFAALLLAQTASQQCAAMDTNLPASLAVWSTPGHGVPDDLTRPLVLKTVPKDQIDGLPEGTKDGGATEIDFDIDKPGIYGIAIDQGAWIDVVPGGGEPLVSVKHGHGPECSTIRKIVRFDLKPGTYRLYVSGLTSVNVKVLLVSGE